MLAERISNTEAQLPQELRNSAVILAGEMAWTAPDALRVVEWLCSQDVAVSGVELWRERDGCPQWIATSQPFPEVPVAAAHEAAQFIREFQDFELHPENLFNMTWGVVPSAGMLIAQAA